MPRYIAFLRAINVGGRIVKMEQLRQLFEGFGFANVETFIASGNVIFESAARNTAALEKKIAAGLREALGYEVATFIRTEAEVGQIAQHPPVPVAALEAAKAVNVIFFADPLDNLAQKKMLALRTEMDDFTVAGREVYWLCRVKQSESKFSNAVLERALGRSATLRGFNTVLKLAAKYANPA